MASLTWGTTLPTLTCALLIVAASAGDYATRSDVAFNGVEVLAIAWAALVLGPRRTAALTLLAWAGQVVGALTGLTSGGAALIDSVSIGVAAVLILLVAAPRRRAAMAPTALPRPAVALLQPTDQLRRAVEAAPALLQARGLTRRECEVATLALTGLSAEQIGGRLFIGRRTVETHLGRAYAKFGVHSRAELADEVLGVAVAREVVMPTTAAVSPARSVLPH